MSTLNLLSAVHASATAAPACQGRVELRQPYYSGLDLSIVYAVFVDQDSGKTDAHASCCLVYVRQFDAPRHDVLVRIYLRDRCSATAPAVRRVCAFLCGTVDSPVGGPVGTPPSLSIRHLEEGHIKLAQGLLRLAIRGLQAERINYREKGP